MLVLFWREATKYKTKIFKPTECVIEIAGEKALIQYLIAFIFYRKNWANIVRFTVKSI